MQHEMNELIIPQYHEPSITSAKKYIDYIIKKKKITVPAIPKVCFILYSRQLIDNLLATTPSLMIDIGSRNRTEIHFCYPEDGLPFAFIGEQLGASMAVVVLEELIALGFSTFVAMGATGHPTRCSEPQANIGDFVLVKDALVYEGTSDHYESGINISRADISLLHDLSGILGKQNISFFEGRIATTDALYRETPQFIAEILDEGAFAIDMETSALYTAARFHHKRICALLYISDIVCIHDNWDIDFVAGDIDRAEQKSLALIKTLVENI
jgi:uridine phosphorylase